MEPIEGPVTPVRADAPCRSAGDGGELRLRSRRFARGRLDVVHVATGIRLGWRDERTGQVHVEEDADLARVHAALKRWDRRS